MNPHDKTNALQTVLPIAPESILIGIDWAENEHEFCAAMPDGTIVRGSCKQKRTAIDQWIAELSAIAPNATLDVCIETSTGGLINALMECPQVRIFPVNPLALSSYRKAFAPGGGKNDPVDAHLLTQFLQHYREQLRELKVNSPQTRELASLTEDRRRFVEQRRDRWQFDEYDVISFVKSKVEQKMPTWKGLGIVNSLIWYRKYVRKTDQPSLEMMRTKLQERLERERLEKEDVPIEDAVGKINPREPDVIQQLRRKMRLMGRAYNTEKALYRRLMPSWRTGD